MTISTNGAGQVGETTADVITRPASPWTYRWRVWEYLMRQARPYLWSALGEAVAAPAAYLVALGVGLGALIDARGTSALGGVTYLQFIGPALLCGAGLTIAFGESSFATFGRFKWFRTMWAITSTPVTPGIAADAHVLFYATRLAVSGFLYFLVLLAFGAAGGPVGILMVPVSVLTGLSCAVWIATLSASIENEAATPFNLVLRFGIIPMSLFSASFFPIEQLPWSVRWLAFASPLWHGNELARGAALGGLPAGQAVLHLVVLLTLFGAGYLAMRQRFSRRLVL